MRRLMPLLLLALLGMTDCAHSPGVSKSESDSVVLIEVHAGQQKLGQCAGVAISDHEIATAAHCVMDPGKGYTTKIKTRDGQECTPVTATAHEDKDAALFRVSGCYLHPARVRVIKMRQGESLSVIGHPASQLWSLSVGVVSRIQGDEVVCFGPDECINAEGFIQTDAAVNPGNSGGGVFDASGQLVAIVSYYNRRNPGLGYATPIRNILRLR